MVSYPNTAHKQLGIKQSKLMMSLHACMHAQEMKYDKQHEK